MTMERKGMPRCCQPAGSAASYGRRAREGGRYAAASPRAAKRAGGVDSWRGAPFREERFRRRAPFDDGGSAEQVGAAHRRAKPVGTASATCLLSKQHI